MKSFYNFTPLASVAELVDALDSKSSFGNKVWVRFPPEVLNFNFIQIKITNIHFLLNF